MFENETYETILERMLARFDDTYDKRQGSVIWDLLSPKALELAQAYTQMDNVLNLGFIGDADGELSTTGELLERRAAEQGLSRKPSAPSEGYVIFNGEVGQLVIAGTRVAKYDAEPTYFITQEDVVLLNGTASVLANAEIGGVSGNVNVGEITTVLGDLAGVVTVTNPEEFTGGLDVESDEVLYERYLEKVQSPSTSGNKYHYISWAKSVVGINDAKVYPLWDGPGTVKVVVINEDRRSPSQTVLTDVTEYIEEQKPVGADVTVVGVTEIPIDINVNITLRSGVDADAARLPITTQIESYLKSVAFTEDIVRYTGVGNAILDASDVIDYADLTLNRVAANIELASTEVPVIGAVTITIN